MSRGLAGRTLSRLQDLPRLCPRHLLQALDLRVLWGLGRSDVQQGPQLLHQQQALPQWRHLLQHRQGLHLLLPHRLHRQELRAAGGRQVRRVSLQERGPVSGKETSHIIKFYELFYWQSSTSAHSWENTNHSGDWLVWPLLANNRVETQFSCPAPTQETSHLLSLLIPGKLTIQTMNTTNL